MKNEVVLNPRLALLRLSLSFLSPLKAAWPKLLAIILHGSSLALHPRSVCVCVCVGGFVSSAFCLPVERSFGVSSDIPLGAFRAHLHDVTPLRACLLRRNGLLGAMDALALPRVRVAFAFAVGVVFMVYSMGGFLLLRHRLRWASHFCYLRTVFNCFHFVVPTIRHCVPHPGTPLGRRSDAPETSQGVSGGPRAREDTGYDFLPAP